MKSNYKRYKGWCDRCDSEIVEKGKKCSNCGSKEKNCKKARNSKVNLDDFISTP